MRRSRMLAMAVASLTAGLALHATPAFGEGSADLNTGPDSAERHNLAGETSNYTVLRVYARAGERLQMGHSGMWTGFPGPPGANPNKRQAPNILVYPPGTGFASQSDPAVHAPLPTDPVFDTEVFDCKAVTAPPAGFIRTRAQELAGPLPSTGGYTPCEFTAPESGIYPVVIVSVNPTVPGGTWGSTIGNPTISALQRGHISMWDVTVRDAAGTVEEGRVFTHRLSLEGVYPVAAGVNAFIYTPSGYEYRASFTEHAGAIWVMTANDRGVVDASTGERTFASFQWGENDVVQNNVRAHFEADAPQIEAPDVADDPRFPIFFNRPDPDAISGPGGLADARGYASAPIAPGNAFSDLALTGGLLPGVTAASGSGGTLRFTSRPQMEDLNYALEIDIDRNGTFGNGSDVVHRGRLSGSGANEFVWDGKDGAGANPPCGDYTFQVRSTLAEIHLAQSDVENSAGTRIQRLSLPDDPVLGDPLAANYDDVDPFKETAVTNASPRMATQGTSGGTFHAWSANTGNTDFVDTWMRLPEVGATGAFEVCATEVLDPPPTPRSPNVQQPTSTGSQSGARPRLSLSKSASRSSVRAGTTLPFTLTVRNPSSRTVRNVRVCDDLPAGLVHVSSSPPSRASNGRRCWTVRRLGPRSSRTLRIRTRVLRGANGRLVNRATATAAAAARARAARSIRVRGAAPAAGGVTG